MHSSKIVHTTWDSLAQHLAERARLEAQQLAGWVPKPWRVPTDEEQVTGPDTVDWCATP